MKRFYLILTACALSLSLAGAQTPQALSASVATADKSPIAAPAATSLTARAPQKRIPLDSDERIMGYFTTDELPNLDSGGWAGWLNYPGEVKVGAIFEDNVIGKYYGGQITKLRFVLASTPDLISAFVCEVDENFDVSDPVSSVDLTSTYAEVGWNDITLTTPVTIEEGKFYLVGYAYEQIDDEWASAAYPIVTDAYVQTRVKPTYGSLVYANINNHGYDWYNAIYGDGGNLCIQAVVKGGGVASDIVLDALEVDPYAQRDGDKLNYSFDIRSDGNTLPTTYKLTVAVDGVVAQTIDTPLQLTTMFQTVSYTLDVSEYTLGNHSFTLSVAEIDGAVPEENTDDDVLEGTFTTYDGHVDRQRHLIELFTSIYCGYCPRGHGVLKILTESYPDKYAWVSIHGLNQGTDPYYLSNGWTEYIETLSGAKSVGYPSAAYDRHLITDELLEADNDMAIGMGYYDYLWTLAAEAFNAAIDRIYAQIPAFVPVDIDVNYDDTSRNLYITVSGEGVSTAQQLLIDNRLTVYLIEACVNGIQEDYDKEDQSVDDFVNYTHSNVLREIVNEYPWGDDVKWTSNSSYSNTVSTTLNRDWDADNMYVVAFISGPLAVEKDDGWYYNEDKSKVLVNNANEVKINSNPINAITTVGSTTDGHDTYYSLDGRQLAAPAKGVSIVKSANGTARKILK